MFVNQYNQWYHQRSPMVKLWKRQYVSSLLHLSCMCGFEDRKQDKAKTLERMKKLKDTMGKLYNNLTSSLKQEKHSADTIRDDWSLIIDQGSIFKACFGPRLQNLGNKEKRFVWIPNPKFQHKCRKSWVLNNKLLLEPQEL